MFADRIKLSLFDLSTPLHPTSLNTNCKVPSTGNLLSGVRALFFFPPRFPGEEESSWHAIRGRRRRQSVSPSRRGRKRERGSGEERFDVSRSKPRFLRDGCTSVGGGKERVLGCIQASNNIRISKAEHRRRGRKPTRIWMRMAQFSAAVALTSETWRALSANLFRLCLLLYKLSGAIVETGWKLLPDAGTASKDIIGVWCEFTRASFETKRSRGKKIATIINFAMFKFKISVGRSLIFLSFFIFYQKTKYNPP